MFTHEITLLGPCAAVIWTPTHRTFFLCFASGTGAETRLIRGGSLILVAWLVGLMQLANVSPATHSATSALARLPGIRGRMMVLRPCQKLRTLVCVAGIPGLRGRSLSDPVRPRPVARQIIPAPGQLHAMQF